jgi:lipopolysaccharide O-acetyltransferase
VTATPAAVRALVLDRLELDPVEAPDELDLLGDGIVDSFGLLELLDALELSLGVKLDFEAAAADDLTTVGGLSRAIAALAQTAATAPDTGVRPGSDPGVWRKRNDRVPISHAAARPARARRLVGAAALGGYRTGARLRDKLFSLAVGGAFASFGRRSVLQLPVRLKGERRIAVGSGCFVGAGSWLQALGDGDGPALSIGDGAGIAGLCVLSAVASVRVGAGVSFARGVYVSDHAHAYDGGAAVRDGGLAGVEPVEIGDGVWLGENVVVLPGARIGERAVIGANSVVSGDIPARSLALGSPARVVRRFDGA